MPEAVVIAIETIGNRARTGILRALLAGAPMTTQEIAERIGATRIQTRAHLLAMEDAGLVVCDVPRDRRHGRVTHWAANYERACALTESWLSFIRGESDSDETE